MNKYDTSFTVAKDKYGQDYFGYHSDLLLCTKLGISSGQFDLLWKVALVESAALAAVS